MMYKRFLLWAAGLLAILAGCLSWDPLAAWAAEPAPIEMEDGEYTVEVAMEGGTGRASVTSPAALLVRDGCAWARIEWSSPNYDYMKVEDEKYLPVNDEGNSSFEIPITVFDEPMAVIGDTTAMSTPHEVEYSLIFHSDSISSKETASRGVVPIVACAVGAVLVACVLAAWFSIRKRRGKR